MRADRRSGRSRDLLIGIGVFVFLMAIAIHDNVPEPRDQNLRFGWEYGNIAASVVEGRGFADPFGIDSGPSAWMPPLYVLVLVAVFQLFGVKSLLSLWVLLILKYAAIAVSAVLLLEVTDRMGFRRYRYLALPLFLTPIYLNRTTFFRELHDVWFNLFLATLVLWALAAQFLTGSRRSKALVLALAFLLPLGAPALALAFLALEIALFIWRTRNPDRPPGRPDAPGLSPDAGRPAYLFALIGVFFAGALGLWTYRNVHALGSAFPIKSNFWFDFYQANVIDDDGVPTYGTFERCHPVRSAETRETYRRLGEMRFVETYRSRSLEEIARDPGGILRRILNRALNAFLLLGRPNDLSIVDPRKVNGRDLTALRRERFIVPLLSDRPLFWATLTVPKEKFHAKVRALGLARPEAVLRDWREKRRLIARKNDRRMGFVRSASIALVPFLCLLGGLVLRRGRRNLVFVGTAVLYVVYLIPYVLVSHYLRYQTPLIAWQTVFTFLIASLALDRLAVWDGWDPLWQRVGRWRANVARLVEEG